MNWYFNLIIYFTAGIVSDFLVTLNWRYVAKDKVVLAVIFSFLTTIVGWVVFYNIITTLDSSRSLTAIFIYSVGIAVGTFLAMKFKFGFRK